MEPRLLLRIGIGASVIGHLALMAGLLFTEARPFAPVKPETIAVDLVTPEEAPQPVPPEPAKEAPSPPEKPPTPDLTGLLAPPKPQLQTSTPPPPATKPSTTAEAHEPAPKPEAKPETKPETKPEPASAPPAPATTAPSPPPMQQAAVKPQAEPPQPPPAPASMPPPQSDPPIMAPEPDVTVKYGVMLGLPEATPADPLGGAGIATAAKIDVSATAKFRQHLRSCSALPPQVAASDKVRIVLRVMMARNGRLAAPPGLIEASASPAKGLALMQAATKALQSCQPYAMLPADKYDEWKVLDLTFTPQDFAPG